jgi:hypothetical protein
MQEILRSPANGKIAVERRRKRAKSIGDLFIICVP